MTAQQIRDRITKAFQLYFGSSGLPVTSLLPTTVTAGKLYEAYVLGIVAEHLTQDEGYNLMLKNGNQIALKSSPGPINRSYPAIEVRNGSARVAEIWTDVEFLSLSASLRGAAGAARGGLSRTRYPDGRRRAEWPAQSRSNLAWRGMQEHRIQ